MIPNIFGNTLYFPGCHTKFFHPNIEKNYENILKKIGISFIKLDDAKCCGIPAYDAGYKDDFYDMVDENTNFLKKHSVNRIITNSPSCVRAFWNHYGLKAEHITKVIYDNVKKFGLKFEGKISYHDPCELGRKLNSYVEPRKILEAVGFQVFEFKTHHENALCCGAGGNLKENSPKVAAKIANLRLAECMTDKVVTTCPMCYKHLKENASEEISVYELSEVLV